MSCGPCEEQRDALFQRTFERLREAAVGHGFELWWQSTAPAVVLLAVPTGPSHGTAEELLDTFKGLAQGLPSHPSSRAARARSREVLPKHARETGRATYRIDTAPPIEVVFIDKLMEGP